MMSLLSEQEGNCAADRAACARDDGDRSTQGSARTAGLANQSHDIVIKSHGE